MSQTKSYYKYKTDQLMELLATEQDIDVLDEIYHALIARVGFDEGIYNLPLNKFTILLEYIKQYLPYESKFYHLKKYTKINTIKDNITISNVCNILNSGISG
tara:strand:+ start:4839 stop:5144 length:306 start_codon:yes stop_codon:yes gene_type:complete